MTDFANQSKKWRIHNAKMACDPKINVNNLIVIPKIVKESKRARWFFYWVAILVSIY